MREYKPTNWRFAFSQRDGSKSEDGSAFMSAASQPNESNAKFLPALPSSTMLWLVQHASKYDLDRHNRVIISEKDLQEFSEIPKGDGVILTPNHADEMDPRVCFEVSRQARKRFVFMCNREAFSEMFGIAGWGLQRIGAFSVERGGHDSAAKRYATEVLMQANDTLVIFPEGEIFSIEIGMQAILAKRLCMN